MQDNAKQTKPKWKLWFTSRTSVPPTPQYEEHDTLEDALRAACEMMKGTRFTVLYIEQPDGTRIEQDAIKRWCDAQPKAA